jgi:hypothetical protein
MSIFSDALSLPAQFEFFAILSYCLHFAKFVASIEREKDIRKNRHHIFKLPNLCGNKLISA